MLSSPARDDEAQPITKSVAVPRNPSLGQTTGSLNGATQTVTLIAKYPLGQPLLRLDGADWRYLLHAACDWLTLNHEVVNRLNVFPVPDGDTGTNMVLTLNAAWAAARIGADDIESVSKAAAAGALQGSRGNSGVILAQILRGFSQGLTAKHHLSAQDLAAALSCAAEVAYQSVPAPIEGTILTVIREVSLAVNLIGQTTSDLRAVFAHLVAAADQAVRQTPDLLPTLKRAGVVDAGGKGLFYILDGMHRALLGGHFSAPKLDAPQATPVTSSVQFARGDRPTPARRWGFDVQCLIEQPQESVEVIRQTLLVMGDSVLVEGDAQAAKIHVHVRDPGMPLSYAVRIGFVTAIVVENMDAQAMAAEAALSTGEAEDEPARPPEPVTEDLIGLVAVVPGPGFVEIFRNLGVAALVEGGAGMNPSTAELVAAIRSLPNRRVLVLPNHSNILLAANQAAQLVQQDDETRQIVVVPSKSTPQGVAAVLAVNVAATSLADLASELQAVMERIDTGEVTQATRTAEFDGLTVEVGDCIGLHEGRLVTRSDNLVDVVLSLLIQMAADESELITLYYGADIAQDEAQNLVEIVRTHYPEQDVELAYGGQPHYHYILSTE